MVVIWQTLRVALPGQPSPRLSGLRTLSYYYYIIIIIIIIIITRFRVFFVMLFFACPHVTYEFSWCSGPKSRLPSPTAQHHYSAFEA